MNVLRNWAMQPPEEPMTSVGAMLRDFKMRRGDPDNVYPKLRDNIVDWCAEAPTLRIAIQRAVRSRRPNGKFHHHQSKQAPYLPAYERVLISKAGTIRRCRSFHELYLVLKTNTIRGIGRLAWYDISTRIGAYLGLRPERIYVHTGVLMGLTALGYTGFNKRDWIEMHELPRPCRREDPDFVEDFLCTYREAFLLLREGVDGREFVADSPGRLGAAR